MEVLLPPGPGYSALFIRGLRGVANSNAVEEAGAVIVKRSFAIAGGALIPDAGGDKLELADKLEVHDDLPWVTYESELALTKASGDIVVLGGRSPAQWAWVKLGTTVWLKRDDQAQDPDGETDRDLQQNLFGWHPRSQTARRNDARMVTDRPESPTTAASDRYDRFQKAQRRQGGSIKISHQGVLPTHGNIVVLRAPDDDEDNQTELLDVSYDFPQLSLTLFIHHGRGPDRDTRWCPEAQPPLVLDTIVLRPTLAKAHALWRRSWRWGEPGEDTLRRAQVTEGDA
ncbi:hypothetical protein ACMGDH_01695 [Sphingomonas sp. DT-207]|uniref:hypothetical protein n=1 Tax=Sphingomonas sp. DT-207 TaxID=3396167 RepID=UPI003F1E40D4